LLLQLYSDGIAITNPLGPKKDAHKLTAFYYQIEDLPDIIRSELNMIQLHAICYTDSLESQESRKTIYHTLVNDLNELQRDGITVPTIDGRIYFAFTTIAADNLSANDLGGFQKNFSSGNFCRHCLISYEHRLIPLIDITFLPRSTHAHDFLVQTVLQRDDGSILQGVKCPSPMQDLLNFHPVNSLPPDLMHDYCEGTEIEMCVSKN
jgi:hypothetical protein